MPGHTHSLVGVVWALAPLVGVVWAWLSRQPALTLTIENRLSAIEIGYRQSKIGYRKSKIENRLSKIDNRKLKIGYLKSTIENRKSAIENRKSTISSRLLKNRIYRLFRSKINERLPIIGYRYFCPLWRSIIVCFTNNYGR